jgi:AraC-like DNA-binding protein
MTADQRAFRKTHFRAPETFDRQWVEWFREEFNRQLYNIDIEPDPDAPFRFEATTRILPDLAIAQSVRSPMRTSHHGKTTDDINIVVPLEGRTIIHFDGESFDLTAGVGWMGRNDTPGIVDMPAGVKLLSVRLRRRLIEPLMKDFGRYAEVQDPQVMRLLLGYIHMIQSHDAIVSSETSHLVTAHVHDLAALAFGATRGAVVDPEGSVSAARFEALKADILSNIGDGGLNLSALAQRHRASTRYVQMLFERNGITFSEFVLEQRLLRAARLLRDPLHRARKVSDIAHIAGFNDVSYFHRVFRRRFGMTPSDVRAAARQNGR